MRPEAKIIGPEKNPLKGGWGGGGGGVRKKILTSRGKAEGLYEFSKIENRRFAETFFFHIISYRNEIECLISHD